MRNIFFIFVAVTYTIMYMTCVRMQREENELVRPMNFLVFSVSFTAVSYMIPLYIQDESIAMLSQGFYYASIDWLLYVVIHFMSLYMNRRIKIDRMKNIIRIVACGETISFLVNTFTRHAFDGQIQDIGHGEMCYVFWTGTFFYDFHLLFTYALVIYIMVLLVYGSMTVPSFYRKKYTIFLAMLILIIVLNALYLFAGQALDISLILYSILATFLMIFSVLYIPEHLVQHAIACVLQSLEQGIICFDLDDRPIFANDQAKKLPWKINSLEEWKDFFVRETGAQYFDGIIEMAWEKKGMVQKEEHSYRILYQKLLDNKDEYIGCFFSVTDLTTARNQLEKADYRATHDSLTGLYNKEFFYEKTTDVLTRYPNTAYLMVCVNIKDFKLVNDIFGPEIGDEVLKKIAQTLAVYNTEECCYGRLENDIFAICMPKRLFSEELLISQFKGVEEILGYGTYQVHVHIGVYEMHDRHLRISSMCDRASFMIHDINNSYIDEVSYYNLHMMKNIRRKKKMVMEIEQAIKNGEIQIYIQPQIGNMEQLIGGEVLVRWMHPVEGLILPGEFIEILERAGLIWKLDAYVWELTCAKLAEWKNYGITQIPLSINVSEADLIYMDFYEYISGLVKKYKISASQLCIELKESFVQHNFDRYKTIFNMLQADGFKIAADEYGQMFSTISLFQDIHWNRIKFQMVMVSEDKKMQLEEILRGIISVAKCSGIEVLCQGIENETQRQIATNAGCDCMQGFYFANPMPAEIFEQKYIFKK